MRSSVVDPNRVKFRFIFPGPDPYQYQFQANNKVDELYFFIILWHLWHWWEKKSTFVNFREYFRENVRTNFFGRIFVYFHKQFSRRCKNYFRKKTINGNFCFSWRYSSPEVGGGIVNVLILYFHIPNRDSPILISFIIFYWTVYACQFWIGIAISIKFITPEYSRQSTDRCTANNPPKSSISF